jgi:peptide/nickel transport system substrate-binding protein
MLMRLFISLVLVLLTVGSTRPARAERDTLTIGISQFPESFHPGIESMMAKAYVLGFARRPFTVYDADWKLVCMLCVELPTIDNGLARPETTPDGRPGIAVTYGIRPEARWGDGTPITTRDVTFTWEVGRHPKSGVMPKEFYRSLYRIEAADDRTFTLHFDKRHFDYNAIDSLELLPAHIEGEAFADPEAYRFRTRYAAETTNKGLYNGPYVISKVVAGSHVVLTRNPQWWGKPPAFSRIVVRAIDNTAALEANLLSGAIDMIAGEIGLNVDQAVALEARHGGRFQVIYKPGLVYEHVDVNLDNPMLADRRIRQALLYALDRQAIVGQIFAGRQPVADTNVSPLDRMYAADVRRYAYDPDAAARLLDEAGWGKLAGGVRVDAAGRPLQLELMTTAGDRTRELVQQVLQSQWKRAGIDVRIRNQPARVFFGDTVSRRRFSAMAMFAWISAPESVPRSTLYSNEIPTSENGWAGQNYAGFRSAEVDALIDAIEVELDEGKRRGLWHRLQALYAEELPALPLFFRANPFVLPRWLKGLVPTGHQYPTTLWVEDWSVAE